MQIDVVTIFPEMFEGVLGVSLLKRAQDRGLVRIAVHDLRRWTHDQRRTVDDRPYGGGPGMVMKPEPIFEAVEALREACGHRDGCQTILMSPEGERLNARTAKALSRSEHLLILCGRYEGVDERVKALPVDRVISIGDYVLTGGELPAMVLMDSLLRFLPGVIDNERATEEESFSEGWLEYPHYTRPPVFRNMAVPEVLLSGDHGEIAEWRRQQAVARTLASRPDLITPEVPGTVSRTTSV
jgi:tRNA (guanine37-N1)-methyltransferase